MVSIIYSSVTLLLVLMALSTSCALPEKSLSSYDAPQITGQEDPELLAAARAAADAVGNINAMAALTVREGLQVFPYYACKPAVLPLEQMTKAGLQATFRINTCHEDNAEKLTSETWSAFIDSLTTSPALTMTQRITLDTRDGIGIDTGTSYLVETLFPLPRYKIAAYLFLGSESGEFRDWEELGFVFDVSTKLPRLVAIYRDSFSSV